MTLEAGPLASTSRRRRNGLVSGRFEQARALPQASGSGITWNPGLLGATVVFFVERSCERAAVARPVPNARIMWSWFQLKAGRAIGARNDIQRLGVSTSHAKAR